MGTCEQYVCLIYMYMEKHVANFPVGINQVSIDCMSIKEINCVPLHWKMGRQTTLIFTVI